MKINKKKILFVCLGNICRSPTAHGVFEDNFKKLGLEDQYEVDSAGTSAFHEGELPDERSRRHALKRGYSLTSRSRQITEEDLEYFDFVFVMDESNFENVSKMKNFPSQSLKVKKLTDLIPEFSLHAVPDPYYGGEKGFELVLDMMESAVKKFLEIYGDER